jgi:AcrR family transcriptional regulator
MGYTVYVTSESTPSVPPPDRPLRRDAERNRQRILGAARELFAQRGLSASLDDIAHHAEVGVGTVYRRFPDKQLLVAALFEDRLEEIVGVLEQGLRNPDPWDGLASALERAQEMQADDRGLMDILFTGLHTSDSLTFHRARMQSVAGELLARAQADGSVRPDLQATDLPVIQILIGSLVDATRTTDTELWRRFLTLLLDGLRTSRDAPSPLPSAAITEDCLDATMQAWRPRR